MLGLYKTIQKVITGIIRLVSLSVTCGSLQQDWARNDKSAVDHPKSDCLHLSVQLTCCGLVSSNQEANDFLENKRKKMCLQPFVDAVQDCLLSSLGTEQENMVYTVHYVGCSMTQRFDLKLKSLYIEHLLNII